MPYLDRDKQNAWARERYRKRRADYFADKECVDCGAVQDLELDHIDPKDKVSHKIWGWSEARFVVEAAKCVARCHDCHWRKTVGNGELTGPKGYKHPRVSCLQCRREIAVNVISRHRCTT